MNKTVSDKIEFIVHKIIVGIGFWIISSVVITYQQYIIKEIGNVVLNLLLYLTPLLVLRCFISVSHKKNQWEPFGSNSDMIGMIIMVTIAVILFLIIGVLKVII